MLIPWTRYLLKNRKMTKTGISDKVDMANRSSQTIIKQTSQHIKRFVILRSINPASWEL